MKQHETTGNITKYQLVNTLTSASNTGKNNHYLDSFIERDSDSFMLPDKLLRIARGRITPAGMNFP